MARRTRCLPAGTITGLVNGDTITASYTCDATANSPAGTYPIVPSLVDPNNRQTNYTVSLVSGTLTIALADNHRWSGDSIGDAIRRHRQFHLEHAPKTNDYEIQTTTDLTQSAWTTLMTGAIPATNSTVTTSEPIAAKCPVSNSTVSCWCPESAVFRASNRPSPRREASWTTAVLCRFGTEIVQKPKNAPRAVNVSISAVIDSNLTAALPITDDNFCRTGRRRRRKRGSERRIQSTVAVLAHRSPGGLGAAACQSRVGGGWGRSTVAGSLHRADTFGHRCLDAGWQGPLRLSSAGSIRHATTEKNLDSAIGARDWSRVTDGFVALTCGPTNRNTRRKIYAKFPA